MSHSPTSTSSNYKSPLQHGGPQTKTRSRARLLLGVGALVVVLGLALGLGLGLGLKHHHSGSPATISSTNSTPSLGTSPLSNFVLAGLQGQAPQTRTYYFTIAEATGAPDGVSKPMLVVNGMFPGPTIEANQHDRIVVNVTNHLPNTTHFQNQTNFFDGTAAITECGIPPGQSLVYNFTLGSFSGTTWWHAHSTQYTDGITGGLVVYPTDPSPPDFPAWDHELLVQMNDLYHTFSTELLAAYLSPDGIDGTPGDEPVADGGTLNGLGQWGGGGDYFNFTVDPNKTYRFRLVNTGSFASIRFSIDNHPLTVIEADGTLVQPYTVSAVVLDVAQRYSVLVHTNSTQGDGTFWMRSQIQTDMFTYDVPGQNADIRGVIRYSNAKDSAALPTASDDPGPGIKKLDDMDVSKLVPAVKDVPPARTRMYTVKVSLQNTNENHFLAFFNSTSWEPLSGTSTFMEVRKAALQNASYAPLGASLQNPDQLMITEDSIQVVDLLVNNLDDGDHPFHLHGHRPYIMGSGAGRYIGQKLNEVNPLRRDTILIPAFSWTILRFVTDNPGVWAFHCHISWHMASGLLMQVNSLPSKAALLDVPQAIIDQCNTQK
ncbi:multicopper oxidase 2A [Cristinia sonorae]|uniref:Multicopper oxidase 2A n=1 Tax=Cristinia sonorae TaxID=1940300 RepID=A0A8K0XM92_9AGAR|nr:multicopper oxidase 2A [Cristinia sonorae]